MSKVHIDRKEDGGDHCGGGEGEIKNYCLIGGAPVWENRNILKIIGWLHNTLTSTPDSTLENA